MLINNIIDHLESKFPRINKEKYDNVGMLIGNSNNELKNILICLDITQEVLKEAKQKSCNLVISHHPLIFKPLTKINDTYISNCINFAIKNDINLYALHTNFDNSIYGINKYLADLLGLKNVKILNQKKISQIFFTCFIPESHENILKNALLKHGINKIETYENGSFSIQDSVSYNSNNLEKTNEREIQIQSNVTEKQLRFIIKRENILNILNIYRELYPYEHPTYYLNELINFNKNIGQGVVGNLDHEINTIEFLNIIKEKLNLKILKYGKILKNKISKISICSGSGSFLINDSKKQDVDLFITSDLKYHDYFCTYDGINICDIGHYESEIFFKDIIFQVLSEKFNNIVVNKCETNTNPINYK